MHESSPPLEKTPAESSVAYSLYRAARFLRRYLLGLACRNGFDITPEQWFILNRLRVEDAVTQATLCEGTQEGHPNMTRILTAMERKGLVAQAPDPVDGRKKRVFLTVTGRSAHDRFAAIVREDRGLIWGATTESDVKALRAVSSRIEANVRRNEKEKG